MSFSRSVSVPSTRPEDESVPEELPGLRFLFNSYKDRSLFWCSTTF